MVFSTVCVYRIFSYLDILALCRCAQVSKFWNVLALDGSNWQRVDLFSFQRDIEVGLSLNAVDTVFLHRFWLFKFVFSTTVF